MNDVGLIVGMDIGNEQSQVCYYNFNTGMPESVSFTGDMVILENQVKLEDIVAASLDGVPADTEELISLVAFLIESTKKSANRFKIHRIYVTIDKFEITYLDILKSVFIRLGYDEKTVSFISHEECYAYYAFSQQKQLCTGGVLLMDYGPEKLKCTVLSKLNGKGTDIIAEESHEYVDEALQLVITGEEKLDTVDNLLTNAAKESIAGKVISSVYLTGKGFDTVEMPKGLMQLLCTRRKVFAGQNLYVKGACFAAFEEDFSTHFKDTVLACENRVTSGLEIGIQEHGINKILRLTKAGINWYEASRTFEFIAEDCNEITIDVLPIANMDKYKTVIELTDFPYREGKMTRLQMKIVFKSDNRCTIIIKDKGFGDFARSSGKVVYKDLEL